MKLLATIAIGNLLFRAIISLPFDMPYGVDMAVRHAIHLAGQDGLTNPEDMETIVGLTVAAMATAIGAAIVWGGHAAVRRMATNKRPLDP